MTRECNQSFSRGKWHDTWLDESGCACIRSRGVLVTGEGDTGPTGSLVAFGIPLREVAAPHLALAPASTRQHSPTRFAAKDCCRTNVKPQTPRMKRRVSARLCWASALRGLLQSRFASGCLFHASSQGNAIRNLPAHDLSQATQFKGTGPRKGRQGTPHLQPCD